MIDTNQLQDYILDLLPPEKRAAVEKEAARDEALRRALRREREVGRLVRGALQEATTPAYGRIPQLMPPMPRSRPYAWPGFAWQRSAAALALVLIIFLGAAGLYQSRQNGVTSATPTLTAATATLTREPTATLAQLGNGEQCAVFSGQCAAGGTAVAQPALPDIQATPAPPASRSPIMSN